ncbi:hypothetical protein [Streptomyces sp. NPDC003710]
MGQIEGEECPALRRKVPDIRFRSVGPLIECAAGVVVDVLGGSLPFATHPGHTCGDFKGEKPNVLRWKSAEPVPFPNGRRLRPQDMLARLTDLLGVDFLGRHRRPPVSDSVLPRTRGSTPPP